MQNYVLSKGIKVIIKNKNHTCPLCHRAEAKDMWKAKIQIRQRVETKRTYYYVEQLLLKSDLANNIVGITKQLNGMDLNFQEQRYAYKLVQFLQGKICSRVNHARQMVSEDVQHGGANMKDTYLVEIAPICRDSLIFISKKLAQKHAYIGQLCVCTRVNCNIHIVDPFTKQCNF